MQWISIKDRLPDKVDDYLVYRGKNRKTIRVQLFGAFDIFSKDRSHHRLRFILPSYKEDLFVTHWMPLPLSPIE